ncbi:Threonine/homoserine exporter RhtA [Methylobacterium goesingense]|uniref:Inner membrane transporter RhtA n=2 Tax=Methylobacterium goesingense TaxID=243690 RepID=A0ABV2LDB5_9HYPH|nr:Threonine/homoserine exporter RhtA [Methylobacterium goesingense]
MRSLVPVAALVASMVSLSVGTSFAKHLFATVGAEGTTALRVGLAALILNAVWRPWHLRPSRADAGALLLYGGVLGAMNLLFYLSLRTIPLGLAIAIEFSGPLTLALAASRRPIDFVWIACAVLGLGLLLPLGGLSGGLDPVGVACALGAALCWALYIVFGQRVGHLHGGRSVAIGMSVAALVVLPFGVASAGTALLDPATLAFGLAVAALSSALPYSLEMVALKRLTKQSFGVLLSLEPAIGSLAGLAILGERLSGTEWLAIAFIVVASVGNTVSASRRRPLATPILPA